MGLDTSHNAWHGGYSRFMSWRRWLANKFLMPPLDLMEGFYDGNLDAAELMMPDIFKTQITQIKQSLPIKWKCLKKDPIHVLLSHSDCDGYINWKDCGAIADRLKWLLLEIDPTDEWYDKTKEFMQGCELAYSRKEKLIFR